MEKFEFETHALNEFRRFYVCTVLHFCTLHTFCALKLNFRKCMMEIFIITSSLLFTNNNIHSTVDIYL